MRRVVADYPLVVTALLLSIFGVAMVYSAGQTDTPTVVARVYKSQLVWLAIGIIGAYGIYCPWHCSH
jgi:rod shape determining protein RodA